MLKYVNFDVVFQEIPDEVTLAINISNCPNGCPGCHSTFLQQDIGEPLTEEFLTYLLSEYGESVTCFCFMGGDSSPDEIVRLARFIHTQSLAKVNVGWYSGKQNLPPLFNTEYFRYIKLGPYIERSGSLKSMTTNQRLFKIDENMQMTNITSRFWGTMKNALLILCLLLSTNVFSQYSITGKIVDKESGEALELCQAIIYQSDDYLKGAVADESGVFTLENMPVGDYQILLKIIGYEELKKDVKVLHNTDLGKIELSSANFELGEVVVERQKQQVVYKIDRKVISASNDIIASMGGNATDILSKIASVRVDADGNVSFRGSSGFVIHVNGKPSIFNASQALQQIPASQIEDIEIITTPSARNQAEGEAGIINIITKKQFGDGLSGAINAFGSTYGTRGGDFMLNKQSGEHRFKLGGMYGQRFRKSDFEQEKTTIVEKTTTTSHSTGPRNGEGYYYVMQAGWQLAKKQTEYNIDVSGGHEGSKNNGNLQYIETIQYPNSAPIDNRYKSKDNYHIYETIFVGSTGFNHKFMKEGHTLNGYFYVRYGGGALERFESNLFDEAGKRAQGHIADEDEHRWTIDGRLDYVLPYSSTGRIETGYQYSSYLEDGDYTMDYWDPVKSEFYNREDIYNTFYFQRGINMIYLLVNQKAGKFEFQAGVRAEHTHQVLRSSKDWANRTQNRLEFFPSMHLGFNPNELTVFTAAYSRRTNRPQLFFMEPYITYRDYYTAEIGNPDIRPEYINAFELSFKRIIGEHTLHFSLFHRSRTDKIERLRVPYEAGITLDSMANVGDDYSSGVELGLNIKFHKNWNTTINGNLYRYEVQNKLNLGGRNESSINYGITLNNNIQLAKNTVIQLDGSFIGPTVRTQGRQEGFFYSDLGVRQQFFEGKLTAGLSFRNFMSTARYRSNIDTDNLKSFTTILPQYPLLTLNIGYTFNNFKQRARGREGSDFFEGTNY